MPNQFILPWFISFLWKHKQDFQKRWHWPSVVCRIVNYTCSCPTFRSTNFDHHRSVRSGSNKAPCQSLSAHSFGHLVESWTKHLPHGKPFPANKFHQGQRAKVNNLLIIRRLYICAQLLLDLADADFREYKNSNVDRSDDKSMYTEYTFSNDPSLRLSNPCNKDFKSLCFFNWAVKYL